MPIPLRFTVDYQVMSLREMRLALAESVAAGMDTLGRQLVTSVRGRMREFKGQEKRNVRYQVTGGRRDLNLELEVSGNLVQTAVDELGLRVGVFPPWGVGSRLYEWVRKKGLHLRGTPPARARGARNARAKGASHLTGGENRRAGRTYRQQPQGQLARPLNRRSKAQRQTLKRNAARRKRENNIRRVAFLIARAIFERGIRPGTPPFAATLAANQRRIDLGMRNAVAQAVKRINRGPG